MPQRGHKIQAVNWDDYLASILTKTHQLALERVGFLKGPWDELDWFVRFATMDLDKVSQGDFLNLQEEIWALLTVHFKSSPDSIPLREQIIEIQQTIRNHLTELVDRGQTMLPSLPGFLWITYPRIAANLSVGASPVAKLKKFKRMLEIVSHRAASGHPDNLVPLLGELLEKVGKPVLRCPHCRNFFLPSRSNQENCSRHCQSVAVMQRHRAEVKAQIKQTRKAKKSSPKTSAK